MPYAIDLHSMANAREREPSATEWQSMPDDLRENVRKYNALVLQV